MLKDALKAAREQLRRDAEDPNLSSEERVERSRALLTDLRRMELEAQARHKPRGTLGDDF